MLLSMFSKVVEILDKKNNIFEISEGRLFFSQLEEHHLLGKVFDGEIMNRRTKNL